MSKYRYDKIANNYLTPPDLVDKGLQILSLERNLEHLDKFDCDVCCSTENIPALNYFKVGQKDGLRENWFRYNWCNPPFDECKKWVQKAYFEQQKGNTSILLIPARVETAYWFDYIHYNPNVKVFWLRKGFKFLHPDSKKELGVFKNALALVLFKGVEK